MTAILALILAAIVAVGSAPRSAPALHPDTTVPASVSWGSQERTEAPSSVGEQSLRQPSEPGDAGANPDAGAPGASPLFAPSGIGTVALGGLATWLDWPGFTAAAGPDLRAAGVKPGQYVRVSHGSRSVIVRIIPGGCWCPSRGGRPVLVDLSRLAFSKLAAPSRGVIAVMVEPLDRLPAAPATSTEEDWKP